MYYPSPAEWDTVITAGNLGGVLDRKVDRKTGVYHATFIIVDPSIMCSFEEIARPSVRAQSISPDDIEAGIGCGNVRMVSQLKWVGLLGAECHLMKTPFTALRGAPLHNAKVNVKIVTMETTIARGSTPEDSKVVEVFCSAVEQDPILLHGWNTGLPASVPPLTDLDGLHKLWYRMVQTGNILGAFEHFRLDDFDKKIMVSPSCLNVYI